MVIASLRNLCLPPGVKISGFLKLFFNVSFDVTVYDPSPLTFCIWSGKGMVGQGVFFLYFILNFPSALFVQKTFLSTH